MAKLSSLKTEVLSFWLRAARWRPLHPLTAFFFRHMNTFLPIRRLAENQHWLAFHHPQPDYPLHILILPKRSVKTIEDACAQPPEFTQDFYQIVTTLIADFDLTAQGYRLINNGGPNQLVPQWHWHLVSEHQQEAHD
jgi:histidine triad (HIT) family protein